MALRLRRGTNADRLQITPVEGELIYTLDTKKLYIGDGSTVGGVVVSGISFVVEDPTPQLGGDLDLNNSDIVGTGNITVNGFITADNFTGNFKGSVFGDDSTLLVDSVANKLNLSVNSITDLSNVDIANPSEGDVLTYNSQQETWESKPLSLSQTVSGDIQGSVFGDDSVLLVDGVNGRIVLTNNEIKDLGDVNITVIPDQNRGAALVWDSFTDRWVTSFDIPLKAQEVRADFYGDVWGQDSTKLIDFAFSKINLDNNLISDIGNIILTNPEQGDLLLYDVGTNSWVNGQATTVSFNTTGDVIGGSIFGLDSTVLVDSTTNTINITNQSITELSDVFYNPATITNQAFLIYDTAQQSWRASQAAETFDLPNIKTNVTGSVFADDSTLLVDGLTGRIYGTIVGEIQAESITGNLTGSVFSDNSTLLVDALTDRLYGDFYGVVRGDVFSDNIRGNVVGSVFADNSTILVDGISATLNLNNNAISDLNDVDVFNAQEGQILRWNGNQWVNITPSEAFDYLRTDVFGTLQGSVLGGDSTFLLDGNTNTLRVLNVAVGDSGIFFRAENPDESSAIFNTGRNAPSVFAGNRENLTVSLLNDGKANAIFLAGFIDQSGQRIGAVVNYYDNKITFGNHPNGFIPGSGSFEPPAAELVTISSTAGAAPKLGVGTKTPSQELDIVGNATVAGFMQVGRYADGTARDAAITAPGEGMIVFNQATQKFQGYVTDTGLAGGGASNATPGWVDLY